MNKKTGIIAAIVVGLLVLCCGGGVLLTRSTFQQLKAVLDADRAFVKTSVASFAKDWDEAKFNALAEKSFQEPEKRARTQKMFAAFKAKLGGLKSVGEIEDQKGSLKADTSGERGRFLAGFRLPAVFEKGNGTFEITVLNVGEKKSIFEINLKSDELFKLSESEAAEAAKRLSEPKSGTKK